MSEVGKYTPLTLPAEAPAPAPQPQQPQALVAGASAVQNVPTHDKAPVEAKPSFYDELRARLGAGEKECAAMLDEAIAHKSLRSVGMLAYLGIDLNEPDKDGNTRLSIACRKGNVKVVQILLENGARIRSVNANYDSPVDFAFRLPTKKMFRVLREIATRSPDGDQYIWSHALRDNRDDVLVWLLAGKYVHSGRVGDFHQFPEAFLKILDEFFNKAAGRKDEQGLTNCVEVLCHVIARRGRPVSDDARHLLVSWEKRAGKVVVDAYERVYRTTETPYKLRPFDEETKVNIELEPGLPTDIAGLGMSVGKITFTPHT
jgi:hypothetical protein